MAKDTTDAPGGAVRGNRRKPVTIDLPAEEVRAREEPADNEIAAASESVATAPRAPGADADAPQTAPDTSREEAVAASSTAPYEGTSATAAPEHSRAETASVETPNTGAPPATETVIPSAFATNGGASPAADVSSITPTPPAEARRTSFPALMAAAIVGGLVGALAVWLLAYAGHLSPVAEGRPDFAADIEALRVEVAELAQAPGGDDLAPLREEVAALQQSVAGLSSGSTALPGTGAVEDLQTRLTALETETQEQQAGAASAGDLSAIRRDVTDLRQRLGGLANAEAATEELRQALAELSARLDTAETAITENGTRADRAEKLGAAVAADALQAALDGGRPFSSELAALRALGVDTEALGALQPHAEAGLPTMAKLRADFEAAIAGIDLTSPLPEEAGVVDRLLESARGLVEVRPSGATEGTDPAAVVARIRAALQAGDLSAALSEWEALPSDIKTATEAWAQSAAARRDADALVARLRSDALAALATEG